MSLSSIIRRAASGYVASKTRSNRPVRHRRIKAGPVKRSHSQKLRLAQTALREVQRRL